MRKTSAFSGLFPRIRVRCGRPSLSNCLAMQAAAAPQSAPVQNVLRVVGRFAMEIPGALASQKGERTKRIRLPS
jgi:hypothetical protein